MRTPLKRGLAEAGLLSLGGMRTEAEGRALQWGGLAAGLGGICWAVPALVHAAQILAGATPTTLWAWHPLHALAGLGFSVALLAWVSSFRTVQGRRSERIGAGGALVGAAIFALANAGEALTGAEAFVPFYGLGLLLLSLGLLVAGVSRAGVGVAQPHGGLLIALGAFPLTFAAQALPAPLAAGVTDLTWLAYGAGWVWLGPSLPRRAPNG